jgi:hypothetical protein
MQQNLLIISYEALFRQDHTPFYSKWNMSHPKLFTVKDKSLLPDMCEMEAKKSAIFSLPFHTYQVKGIYPCHILPIQTMNCMRATF